jgi:hypothetical protein
MVEEEASLTISAGADADRSRVMAIAYAGENLKGRKRNIESLYDEAEGMNSEIKDSLTLFFVFSLSIVEEYSAQILAKYVISDEFQHDLYEYLDSEMTQAHREELLNRCGFLDDSTRGRIGNVRGIWKKLVRKPHAPIDWEDDNLVSKMEIAIEATDELHEWLIFTPRIERAAKKATRLDEYISERVSDQQEEESGDIVLLAASATVGVDAGSVRLIVGPEPRLREQKSDIEEKYAEEESITGDIRNQLRAFFVYSHGMVEEHSTQLIQKHLVDDRFREETREYVSQMMSQGHREKLLVESGIFQKSEDRETIVDDIRRVSELRHRLAHQPNDPIDWETDEIQLVMETAIDVSIRLVDALKDASVLEEVLSEKDNYL